MNHCLDCNSYYANPGTCNCFAPGGKRALRTYVSGGETATGTFTMRFVGCAKCGQCHPEGHYHACEHATDWHVINPTASVWLSNAEPRFGRTGPP